MAHDHRTGTDPHLVQRCGGRRSATRRGWLAHVPGRHGRPHVVGITVVAADRPHRFSYRWVYPPGERATEANSTLVTFTLAADGDERTRLRVVETGLDQMDMADDEKQKFLEQHRHGWQVQGDRLRDLFAAGHASSP